MINKLRESMAAALVSKKALKLEKEAAYSLADTLDSEPTRGILFRSAATLAMDCRDWREAEKLVNQGLAGNPNEELADELRNLYEDINLARHLAVGEIELASSEIQMSLSGNQVGLGFISSEEFIGRFKKFELLAYRTIERKLGKQFRKSGRVSKSIKMIFQPYLSVPRVASFAVTIRVGKSKSVQLDIFKGNEIQSIIDDIIKNIMLINDGKIKELKESINDKDYYQNFVSLTKAIAPDGNRIRQVGFTIRRDGKETNLGLVRQSSDFNFFIESKSLEVEQLEIEGLLRMADATKNIILIIEHRSEERRVKKKLK